MEILITGGAGYVGCILVDLLLKKGYKITVFDNLMFGVESILKHFINPNFNFIKGDIRHEEEIKQALEGKDLVIHLAAIVGYPACNKDQRRAKEVNINGTENIVKNLLPNQKFIFASTGSNYGEIKTGKCTEQTPLNPQSLYAETKIKGEEITKKHDNCVIYRYATAFGLSSRPRLDLMPNDFVFQALKNKSLIVYEKDFKRSFIHVKDMADSFLFAIENFDKMKGETYNVGSDNMNATKEDVVNLIQKVIPVYVHYGPLGKDLDKRNYEVDYEKLRSIGFKTTISLEEGINELVKGLDNIHIVNPYLNSQK